MGTDRSVTLQAADGRRLKVYLAGPQDGVPLLFHHGTPGTGIPYGPMVEAMAERGLRYVAVNRPGYGASDRRPGRDVAALAADAAAVLDGIGADRAYVMGYSGGGPHALACGALLPERVIGVATVGCIAPYAAEGLEWTAGMGEENVAEFGAALAGAEALEGFIGQWTPVLRQLSGEQVADELGDLVAEVDRAALTGEYGKHVAESMREGLSTSHWGWFDDDLAFTRPWGFDLGEIGVPVHLWQGEQDRMVPFAHGEWLARHVGNACAHLLAEDGHLSLAVGSIGRILDELRAGA